MLKKFLKISIVILAGLFCSLLMLEAILQISHFVSSTTRQHPQIQPTTQSNLTIMCVGESMTAQHLEATYTEPLQKILAAKYPGKNVQVINKGIIRSTSYTTLRDLVPNIKRYKPQIVIAMIGINDVQTFFTKTHIQTRIAPAWWHKFRSIYLLKSLYLDFKSKQTFKQDIPKKFKNFQNEMDYYLLKGFRSYFMDKDYPLLDNHMLTIADNEFSKTFWEAKTLLNQQKNDSAIQLFNKAIQLNPTRPEPYALLYISLVQMNITPDPELKKTAEKNCGGKVNFFRNWGMWQQHYENTKEALDYYEQGQRLATTPAVKLEFEALYADTLRQNNLKRLGAKKISEVLKQDPNNLLALRNLGFTYYEWGYEDKACYYLEKLQQLDPDFDSTYDALGNIYISMYQANPANKLMLKKAKRMLEQAYRKSPAIDFGGNKLLSIVHNKLTCNDQIKQENERFAHNYLKIYEELSLRNIQLIAMQYPRRSVQDLKKIFPPDIQKNIIFVDNQDSFEQALVLNNYHSIFIDRFAWDFGHYTKKGANIIAKNAAAAIKQFMTQNTRKKTSPAQ